MTNEEMVVEIEKLLDDMGEWAKTQNLVIVIYNTVRALTALKKRLAHGND